MAFRGPVIEAGGAMILREDLHGNAVAKCRRGRAHVAQEVPKYPTEGNMTDWRQRIEGNPAVCHGKPCIKGTRIMVSVVLDNLADGLTGTEIVEEYPPLTLDDVQAAIAYAAALTRDEELIPLR